MRSRVRNPAPEGKTEARQNESSDGHIPTSLIGRPGTSTSERFGWLFCYRKAAESLPASDEKASIGADDSATLAMGDGALSGESAAWDLAQTIGAYRLVKRLGQGGIGSVCLAEQTQPVRRKVALKLIKPAMDTEEVVARFSSERQALAMMEHPAIARVYDAGSTPEVRPYFAMEYVEGVPITDYCESHHIATPAIWARLIASCGGSWPLPIDHHRCEHGGTRATRATPRGVRHR
jgi:serine/threonine protein kinase